MNDEYYQFYLDELKEIAPCTGEERTALLEKRGTDSSAKERLVEGHLVFALAAANEFRDKGLTMADLVQEANLALTMAVEEYTEGDFLDFAKEKMTAALRAALDIQDTEKKIEETMLARVNVLQEVSGKLAEELGHEASVEELAERMQMTSEEIKDIMKLAVDALSVSGEFAQSPAEASDSALEHASEWEGSGKE